MSCRIPLAVVLHAIIPLVSLADEPAKKAATEPVPVAPTQQELIKKLETELTNSKLIGTFTVTGKEGQPPRAEEYTISSALKLPDGDLWLLKSRVKYGDKDVTLPIPLEIKWAGDTPVITMTNMEIPGLGTFSTRVVLYEGRYAGTWQHGKVGGHLFGRIEKVEAPKADAPKTEAK